MVSEKLYSYCKDFKRQQQVAQDRFEAKNEICRRLTVLCNGMKEPAGKICVKVKSMQDIDHPDEFDCGWKN